MLNAPHLHMPLLHDWLRVRVQQDFALHSPMQLLKQRLSVESADESSLAALKISFTFLTIPSVTNLP